MTVGVAKAIVAASPPNPRRAKAARRDNPKFSVMVFRLQRLCAVLLRNTPERGGQFHPEFFNERRRFRGYHALVNGQAAVANCVLPATNCTDVNSLEARHDKQKSADWHKLAKLPPGEFEKLKDPDVDTNDASQDTMPAGAKRTHTPES
jgi:hypothetical protein